MNRKAKLAWDLYLKMDTSAESFNLLQLIANDCYKVHMFKQNATLLYSLENKALQFTNFDRSCIQGFSKRFSLRNTFILSYTFYKAF